MSTIPLRSAPVAQAEADALAAQTSELGAQRDMLQKDVQVGGQGANMYQPFHARLAR